ncbi:hypothetical protein GQ54DRAFT_302396 [Martensiomyces pterosporus]|nr:hypothetical protein GQ54DRAFT_302396 [Martensiomyces pterosporus]
MSTFPRTPRYARRSEHIAGNQHYSSASNEQLDSGIPTHLVNSTTQDRNMLDSDSSDMDDVYDSDDPTNTAMFLDERDEDELRHIMPGTPLAFQKLGQLTAKSITRQKKAQTPAKQTSGAGAEHQPRYSARQSNSLATATPAPSRNVAALNKEEASVPLSVRAIRSSKRASSILSKIKSNSPPNKVQPTPSNVPALKFSSAGHHTSLDPDFDKNEFSPIAFSKLASWKDAVNSKSNRRQQHVSKPADNGYQTPKLNSRPPGSSTPYSLLRALSEKSNESRLIDMTPRPEPSGNGKTGAESSNGPNLMSFLDSCRTPKQKSTNSIIPQTPLTEHRRRIDSLKEYFSQRKSAASAGSQNADSRTPLLERGDGGLLISFDMADQSKSGLSNPLTSQLSQVSSIRKASGPLDLLHSPSPMRTANVPINGFGESPLGLKGDSISPLLLGESGERQGQDTNKPIPFDLNQALDRGELASGSRSNLIDLSSRLNSSMYALNAGLRGHLQQTRAQSHTTADIGEAAWAIQQAGEELNQSLAAAIPNDNLIDASFAQDARYASELEGQVKTLRQTMEDTKGIMSAIQKELGDQRQGYSTGDAKLDDIVKLLGALDMRLHLLEGRQKLDMAPQRSSAGSTKIHHGGQPRDIISRIGQAIVYCLGRYPLMIIGALFIVLLSELLVIGGYGLNIQTVRGFGMYAFEGVRKHIIMPPPPPS